MNSEAYIVDLLKTQDKRAIAMLYDHCGAALYGVVLRIVGSESIAEDVIQDAFIKIWKNADRYDRQKGSLFTWVLNITRNTAIDTIRSSHYKRRQQMQPLDKTFSMNRSFTSSINVDQIGLKEVVEGLDYKYREVIDLIYFRGYTQKEVEEELKIPLGTVKTRVRIGLRELRKIFQDDAASIFLTLILFAFFFIA